MITTRFQFWTKGPAAHGVPDARGSDRSRDRKGAFMLTLLLRQATSLGRSMRQPLADARGSDRSRDREGAFMLTLLLRQATSGGSPGILAVYSCRSALIGSNRNARRAGMKLASVAVIAIKASMPANVAGSVGLTPCNRLVSACEIP
jgi:hypothetical protein